jgi:NTP pyrophosphatase (non-canonical NTP hydrolase)
MVTFEEYEELAMSTKIYGAGQKIIYPALKLNGEAGEVAEKIGKVLRDKDGLFTKKDTEEIAKELGDVLWYITALAQDIGASLEDIAKINVEKVLGRRERGTIHGDGDNR